MAFQERFRKAYANWRKNPFTGADLSQVKTENGLVIPSSSPYFIQLVEVPKKDSPSSVSVFNVTDNVQMIEVSTAPGQNQFRVDYPPPDGQGTGLVEFSSLDAGKTVNISYNGTGSPVVTEFLDTFMTHPLNEATGDMYYFDDGEVKRIGNAINVATKKLKSTILSPADPTSNDTVQDKVISNAQAKKWEDHANSAHGIVPVGSIVAWLGGYFTNSTNGGYTVVLGGTNNVAGANSYLNQHGWYVCDGSQVYDPDSPIFNVPGRYLPKLTDGRFIEGLNVAGNKGGTTYTLHSHPVGSYAISSVPSHSHAIGYTSTASSIQSTNHTHDIPVNHTHQYDYCVDYPHDIAETTGVTGGDATTTGISADHSHFYDKANAFTEAADGHAHNITGSSEYVSLDNRPMFLSCFYIIRIK